MNAEIEIRFIMEPLKYYKCILPNVEKNDLQFILFHHINDKGTKTTSFASLKSFITEENVKKQLDPFPYVYMVNHIVNNIFDMDLYRKNVDLIDVSLQKMGDGNNTLFCMSGKLFEGNSLIKGAKVFNWEQETPEVN